MVGITAEPEEARRYAHLAERVTTMFLREQELNERLKLNPVIEESSKPDLNKVKSIFEYAANRDDMVLLFATALASLQHMLPAGLKPELDNTIAMLAEKKAVVWENEELFIEASDKLPGKLVIPWFEVTKKAKGADYLIERTLKLPYRLWAGTAHRSSSA